MWFSVEEVVHGFALDSEIDNKPFSFDLSDFAWIKAYYVVSRRTKFGRDFFEKYKSYWTLSKTFHFLVCAVRRVWSSSGQRHRQAWSRMG